MKIFIVDDETISNYISVRLIKQIDPAITICEFTDANKAIAQLPIENPDIIFLDVNMPQMSGWEFLDIMKEHGWQQKVYILSSSLNKQDQEKAQNYTNTLGFLKKPAQREMFAQCLKPAAKLS
jgi:CheY-like chemotaxis protein